MIAAGHAPLGLDDLREYFGRAVQHVTGNRGTDDDNAGAAVKGAVEFGHHGAARSAGPRGLDCRCLVYQDILLHIAGECIGRQIGLLAGQRLEILQRAAVLGNPNRLIGHVLH